LNERFCVTRKIIASKLITGYLFLDLQYVDYLVKRENAKIAFLPHALY